MHLAIITVTSTERFVGPPEAPRQVLHVTVDRGTPQGPVQVVVSGGGVAGQATVPEGLGPARVEVPLDLPSNAE